MSITGDRTGEMSEAAQSQTDGSRLVYSPVIPVVAFAVFAFFALLWAAGFHSAYFGILDFLTVDPFRFPFLDTHAVLSAAECQRQEIEIYVGNACDALNRPHVYSPLWLSLIPGFVGTADTHWVGLIVDLAFIASLGILFRPSTLRETTIMVLVVLSPTTLFALERANNDIVVFILVLGASVMSVTSRRQRIISYTLILLAGLLKYYPLILLAFLARERWRAACLLALCAAATILLFGAYYWADLGKALANIPDLPYLSESFSALNLPYGFADAAQLAGQSRTITGASLLALLIAALMFKVWRSASLLFSVDIGWRERELRCLASACLLVPACFFAGHNNAYRGILLLLAVPGFLHLRAMIDDAALRRWLGRMIFAVVFLLWGQFLREALPMPLPNSSLFWPLILLKGGFWFVRELVWWWLMASLLSLAASYVLGLPLVRELLPEIRWLRRALAR